MYRWMIVFNFMLAYAAVSTGCRSLEFHSEAAGGPNDYKGSRALLYLRNEIGNDSRATDYFWGVTHMGSADRNFRELFTYYAGKRLNWKVADIGDMEQTEPDVADLLGMARDSGGDFLLVGTVQRWHQSYVFLLQWSRIRFSLTCYSLNDGEVLWRASSRTRKFYAGNRRVLIKSLDEMFEELKNTMGAGD